MLKRHVELTPLERRSRRIRATFLSVGAAALVAALLAVAYVGLQFYRREPPTYLLPSPPPDAELVVATGDLLDRALALPSLEASQATRYLSRNVLSLRPAFHPTIQVFYWKGAAPTDAPRWLAYLPLSRSQAFHRQRIAAILAAVDSFRPEGSPALSPAIYYRFERQGLVFSSVPDFPPYEVARGAIDVPAVARFESRTGWLPPAFATHLEAGSTRIAIDWSPNDIGRDAGTGRQVVAVPWFHPVLGQPKK